MSNTRIPLLIDTDPGVDDALAILMAFDDPRHDIVGLTIAEYVPRQVIAMRRLLDALPRV